MAMFLAQDAGSQTSAWVPFFSALAGGLIGSIASLGGIWLTGRQRKQERSEERADAERQLHFTRAAAAIQACAGFQVECQLHMKFGTPSIDELRLKLGAATDALALLVVGDPSDEVSGLAGRVSNDLVRLMGVLDRNDVDQFVERWTEVRDKAWELRDLVRRA